jgi:hypothetical protein
MRNKKEAIGKFRYKSLFTGEYVMAHQWVAEILVQRKADRDKYVLPDKFWLGSDNYSKEFRKQVQQAAKLIKKYSEEAVLTFIKNNPWKFSLFTKENIENIQKEQYIIDNRNIVEIETQDAFEFISKKSNKKSLLGKLNGKKEN